MILSPRYVPRLAATVGLFTRYGLADFAKQQGLEGLAREPEPGEDHGGSPDVARAFRKRLVELGPAYIKLGQVLSTRPDLLPDSYIRELEKLQDDVDPIPVEVVKETIETELGGRLSKLFATFEEEPLGTASLGQVHAAELRDGRPVVVKVQRPHIRNLLADDLAFFDELATFLSEHTSAGSRIDLIGIVQQLERALADELDYRVEARNVAQAGAADPAPRRAVTRATAGAMYDAWQGREKSIARVAIHQIPSHRIARIALESQTQVRRLLGIRIVAGWATGLMRPGGSTIAIGDAQLFPQDRVRTPAIGRARRTCRVRRSNFLALRFA